MMSIYCCERSDCPDVHCPGRVGKVGRRYPAAEPLPPSVFPSILKRAARVALLGVIGLLLYGGLLLALVVH